MAHPNTNDKMLDESTIALKNAIEQRNERIIELENAIKQHDEHIIALDGEVKQRKERTIALYGEVKQRKEFVKLDLLLRKSETEGVPHVFWIPCDGNGIPVISVAEQCRGEYIALEQKKLALGQKIYLSEACDILLQKSEVDDTPQIFWIPYDKDGMPIMSISAAKKLWLTKIGKEKDVEIASP